MTFQKKLIQWFKENQRPLPWRRHYRPYEVWVSEIMLQQTQVKTALPYFKRWMKAFPTIKALALSSEKKVLKVWQGLGYYSRARNLRESAKVIRYHYRGVFPDKFEDILALKGIGRYSAGAIASIAFNQSRPIVDGNVFRVLSRLYAIRQPIDVEKNKQLFWRLEEKLIPKHEARFFNQGLMELGALVCASDNPACALCPVHGFCKAFKEGRPENYPVRKRRKKQVRVTATALVLKKDYSYLLRKRPLGEIMGGLWEFPEWKLERNKKIVLPRIRAKTLTLASREFGLEKLHLSYLGSLKRNYTHHLETLHVFLATLGDKTEESPTRPGPWPMVWVTKKNFRHYPFSSAHARITQMI